MREFTHAELLAAATEVAKQTATGRVLREETNRLVAEAWAQGELTYCVSNQFAMQLLLELTLAKTLKPGRGYFGRWSGRGHIYKLGIGAGLGATAPNG